jgi:hypothetical protein
LPETTDRTHPAFDPPVDLSEELSTSGEHPRLDLPYRMIRFAIALSAVMFIVVLTIVTVYLMIMASCELLASSSFTLQKADVRFAPDCNESQLQRDRGSRPAPSPLD